MNLILEPHQNVILQLNYSTSGMRIHCRTSPKVEEFFRQQAGGEQVTPMNTGYKAMKLLDGSPLNLWYLSSGRMNEMSARDYSFASNVSSLKWRHENGHDVISLAFLRAVGISERTLTFLTPGVFSQKMAEELGSQLGGAIQAFISKILVPVTINITISER